MTFEEAKQQLIEEGWEESKIRRMKYSLSDNGAWPVWEEKPDTPSERGEDSGFLGDPKIFHYKIGDGTLNPSLKEFWIPCAFDGVKQWRELICAPHWMDSKEERDEFCSNYRISESGWDEGERSGDPIRYLKTELSTLRSTEQLNGASEIPKGHRKRAKQEMTRLGAIGLDYLASAFELSLQQHEPAQRQVSKEQMKQGQTISPYCEQSPFEIIELAYRAGKISERVSLHYRGIPAIAERGCATAEILGQGRPSKKQQKRPPGEKSFKKKLPELLKADSDHLAALEKLVADGDLLENPTGSYTPKEGGRSFSSISFRDSYWAPLKKKPTK